MDGNIFTNKLRANFKNLLTATTESAEIKAVNIINEKSGTRKRKIKNIAGKNLEDLEENKVKNFKDLKGKEDIVVKNKAINRKNEKSGTFKRKKEDAVVNLKEKKEIIVKSLEDLEEKEDAVVNISDDMEEKEEIIVKNLDDMEEKEEIAVKNLEDFEEKDKIIVNNLEDLEEKEEIVVTNLDDLEEKEEIVVRNLEDFLLEKENIVVDNTDEMFESNMEINDANDYYIEEKEDESEEKEDESEEKEDESEEILEDFKENTAEEKGVTKKFQRLEKLGDYPRKNVELKTFLESFCEKKVKPKKEDNAPDELKVCPVCGKLCLNSKLYRHVWRHNNKDKSAGVITNCHVCGKLIKEKSLPIHMQLHADRSFDCTICSATFKRADYLRTHMNMPGIHAKLENCEICGALIPDHGGYYIKHMASHNIRVVAGDRRYTKKQPARREENKNLPRTNCQYCAKSFLGKSRKQIIKHANNKHGDAMPFYCNWCDTRFSTRPDQRYHEDTEHPVESADARQPKNCAECGKPFARKHDHDKHVLMKHVGRKICEYCPQHFETSDQLYTHTWVNHKNVEVLTCDKCDLHFKCQITLNKHINNMHLEQPGLKCHHCGKILKNKYTLTCHLNSHAGVKSHKCDLCEAAFVQRSDMTKHRTSHFRSFAIGSDIKKDNILS